jgi:mxaA protein
MTARGAVLGLLLAMTLAGAAHAATLQATTEEPRAFGYQVGDVVQRRITVEVPAGLVLDENSLPRPGARGTALELRALRRSAGSQRMQLELDYQVFLSPSAVRTLELPSLTLRYDGTPRAQDVRIDAWPITVAPLVPVEVSPRTGLGELQPDAEPLLIDTLARRWRLFGTAVLLCALLAYLGVVYLGLPWWGARQRPFALAWRQLNQVQAPPWREACQRLHAAFNQSAGEVLFEHGVGRFTSQRAAFEPLKEDIVRFLRLSQREFFEGGAHQPEDAAWLTAFCKRCRDAERGT